MNISWGVLNTRVWMRTGTEKKVVFLTREDTPEGVMRCHAEIVFTPDIEGFELKAVAFLERTGVIICRHSAWDTSQLNLEAEAKNWVAEIQYAPR